MDRQDSEKKPVHTGHGTRMVMRYAVVFGVVAFLFLVGYFLMFGPLHQEEAANPPVERNIELENEAAPAPSPTP